MFRYYFRNFKKKSYYFLHFIFSCNVSYIILYIYLNRSQFRIETRIIIAINSNSIADRSRLLANESQVSQSLSPADRPVSIGNRMSVNRSDISRRRLAPRECRSCSEWKINRMSEEGAVNPLAALTLA